MISMQMPGAPGMCRCWSILCSLISQGSFLPCVCIAMTNLTQVICLPVWLLFVVVFAGGGLLKVLDKWVVIFIKAIELQCSSCFAGPGYC